MTERPASGKPRTEAGRKLRSFACWEFHAFSVDTHNASCGRTLDLILAIEAEARVTPPALPFTVLRLAEAIDDHNLWMGGLEDHGEGVGCSTDCAGDIYARLTNREAPPDA